MLTLPNRCSILFERAKEKRVEKMEERKEQIKEDIINKIREIENINMLEYIDNFIKLVIEKWSN